MRSENDVSNSTRSARYLHGRTIQFVVLAVLAGVCLSSTAGCNILSARGQNAAGVRQFEKAQAGQMGFDQPMRQFQEAINTDPDNPNGYYNLAATHHRVGLVEQSQEDLNRAEDLYNMCLDRDENHREAYRGLAVLLAQQGHSEKAFRLLKGWVDGQPGMADARVELARLTEEYGDKMAAKEHLVEAIKIDPNHPHALAALGKIREGMGDTSQALADYQRSLQQDRFQPQVATRVAALQTRMNARLSAGGSNAGTRMVDKQSTSLK